MTKQISNLVSHQNLLHGILQAVSCAFQIRSSKFDEFLQDGRNGFDAVVVGERGGVAVRRWSEDAGVGN